MRRAYRSLAKQYHPDINPSADAHKKFMEINTAYEFLTDRAQRANYERLLSEEKIGRAEQERRETIYKLWVEHQQKQVRYRDAMASEYAARGKKVPHSKLYGRANWLTNVIAIGLFCVISVVPVWRYIDQLSEPEESQRPIIFFAVPMALGLIFVGYGYYYWFVLKTDKQ